LNPSQPRTETVLRVVRFGLHAPSARKRAMLDDALRRQTVAYGRALEAARPHAIARLRIAAQLARTTDKETRAALIIEDRAAQREIANAAYRAARSARTASIMADGLADQVLATVQSWIGWRERFRAERPGRIARALERLREVEADPAAAVEALQTRRPRATITVEHVMTSATRRLERERERRPPAYPAGPRIAAPPEDRAALLGELALTARKEDEDRLRDRLATDPKIGRTPLSWSRASGDLKRGVSLIRGDGGRIDAFLPGVLPDRARRAAKVAWTGDKTLVGIKSERTMPRSIGLRVPLSFPRHAWQYLDGWTPRTAKLVAFPAERGWRYELHVAFARQVAPVQPDPKQWIGLDRGVANVVAVSDASGAEGYLSGNRLAPVERRLRNQRERDQQRGRARAMRATKRAFRDAARNEVNRIAKHVARLAVRRGAMVAAEDLRAFARGDTRTLSRAQYAALLQAVERRLELAGYRPVAAKGKRVWQVQPAYTSTTCPECRKVDAASRIDRDHFVCTACGHAADADLNAARNIARKGHETHKIARSRKAARRGGEGPPASAGGVVAAPASAAGATVPRGGANRPKAGGDADGARTPPRARSASPAVFEAGSEGKNAAASTRYRRSGSSRPRNAG
jgi:transposase